MVFLAAALTLGLQLQPYKPTTVQVAESYKRADTVGREWRQKALRLNLASGWIEGGKALFYRRDEQKGIRRWIRVDASTGEKSALFDPARMAEALRHASEAPLDPLRLPIEVAEVNGTSLRVMVRGRAWIVDSLKWAAAPEPGEPERPRREGPWVQDAWEAQRNQVDSPDEKWSARIEGHNILVGPAGRPLSALTTDGGPDSYYARIQWSPDSTRLTAVKVNPGDRKKVYLIQNSPPAWGPAVMTQRVYDRPGDRIDTFDIKVFDPASKQALGPGFRTEYGDLPWLRPTKDGAFTFEAMDRGYGRWRQLKLNPKDGSLQTLIDLHPSTFVDSTSLITRYLDSTDEVVYSSEQTGWHQLYLSDGKGGSRPITRGQWVVRGLASLDEEKRELVFAAGGVNQGEDPYNIHYYRVKLDGSGLTSLTPAPGSHFAVLSPDGNTLVDSYSSPAVPPVHELRNARTGALITTLEKADISELVKSGWRAPQPFVAKGRDGATDIYGLVFRPTFFDPAKTYPVLEDIYAGPQDSFVPKTFSADSYLQRMAELGFIVVKIDGMGTRNRSKAFHDVCYKNLADAGFPDRILWIKALAREDPSVDASRVGIFGTSAGGQNAAGAVLFRPDFYKVAVASCGCHDNRLDKIWWNEQWMGLMGPHYARCSNIENAGRLKGKLMLMVGELDTNVPPESTYRFAAKLQEAGKDFELVVIPNSDHTAGGPYGERRRRDFLVRNLLGVEPPDWNSGK